MASAKESSASPKERLTDEEVIAVTEGRFCRPCRRVFKLVKHFDQHAKLKHSQAASTPEVKKAVESVKPGERIFLSPKAAGLRLVIPGHQGQFIAGGDRHGGQRRMLRPLYAEFENGFLKTSNRKIIAYLTGDIEACLKLKIVRYPDADPEDMEPCVYKDDRYPVFEQGALKEMALTI